MYHKKAGVAILISGEVEFKTWGIPSKVLVAQSCPTLCDPITYSLPGFSVNGIFLTQGANPGLLHCKQILYRLRHLELMIKGSKMSVHQDSIIILNAYCGAVPKDGHHQSLLSFYVNTIPHVKRWSLCLFPMKVCCDILWPSVSSWLQVLQSSPCRALNSCQPALTLLVVPPALGY